SPDRIASNNTFTNTVSIDFDAGYQLLGENTQLDHVSSFATSGTYGINLEVMAPPDGLVASAFATGAEVVGAATGVQSQSQSSWGIAQSNVFGATTAFNPLDSHVTSQTTIDPALGSCLVYVPPTSPMTHAGPNGTPIGADIRDPWLADGT